MNSRSPTTTLPTGAPRPLDRHTCRHGGRRDKGVEERKGIIQLL